MCRVRSPIPIFQEGCRVLHEKTTLSDQAILQGLNANPQIRNRIASLLAVVQDASGDLKLADAAEMRLIEEKIRCMGQEAMQARADKQVQECEQEVRLSGQALPREKNSAGTPPLATSA